MYYYNIIMLSRRHYTTRFVVQTMYHYNNLLYYFTISDRLNDRGRRRRRFAFKSVGLLKSDRGGVWKKGRTRCEKMMRPLERMPSLCYIRNINTYL